RQDHGCADSRGRRQRTSDLKVANAVETLRWGGDHVEFIDQRKLPGRIEYVRCHDAQEVAAAIRDLVVRGAPAIGCAAAYGVALDAVQGTRDLTQALAAWRARRPPPVNLYGRLDRMQALIDAAPPDRAATLVAEALAIHAEDLEINYAIGRNGLPYVPDGARVMTYCNTGALATAGYGTA